MKLYLIHGEDLLLRSFRALIVLGEDEIAARNVIAYAFTGLLQLPSHSYGVQYPVSI